MKVALAVRIPSCLGYGPNSFNVYGYDAEAKISVFFPIDTAL